MFSAIYNWFFSSKKVPENGLDDKISQERAFNLPFAWRHLYKHNSAEDTILKSTSVTNKNTQKLSKIHCDSDQRILYANEYKSKSNIISDKFKD